MRIRSLRTRWTLALVAVCVLEAALVAVAVRVTTSRAFAQFVLEEAFDEFVERVGDESRGDGTLRLDPLRPPGPPRGGERRPSPGSLGRDVAFGLADADGRILRAFDDFVEGDVLSAEELARGRTVLVDGRRVATAFVPRNVSLPADFSEDSPEGRFIASSVWALAFALTAAVALALVVGFWLAGRTVLPIRKLTSAVRAVAGGDLTQSVTVQSDDEVGELAKAFNSMSARLAEANALRTKMTADVSHDLRTPVTAVLGTLELIETGVLAPTPARLKAARLEAERLARLVENFHTLALADAGELPIHLARLDPAEALCHTATLFEAKAHAAGVEVHVDAQGSPHAQADADRLAQVLSNLVSNSLRHTPSGGRVTLMARPVLAGVEISVADTGSGIPSDLLSQVFERSVRGDASRSGQGSGLGLSIVRSLVRAMGGTVTASAAAGEGTTIALTLPVWRES